MLTKIHTLKLLRIQKILIKIFYSIKYITKVSNVYAIIKYMHFNFLENRS